MLTGLSDAQATRPVPAIDRAVIISIDGLRPDVLLRATTPALHALLDAGTFPFHADTTDMAATPPSPPRILTTGAPPPPHVP